MLCYGEVTLSEEDMGGRGQADIIGGVRPSRSIVGWRGDGEPQCGKDPSSSQPTSGLELPPIHRALPYLAPPILPATLPPHSFSPYPTSFPPPPPPPPLPFPDH